MDKIQAMFPVALPRARVKGEKEDDYNNAIAANENAMNQNFRILYNALQGIYDAMNPTTAKEEDKDGD